LPAAVLQPLLTEANEVSFKFDDGRRRYVDQRHGAAVRDATGESMRRSPAPAIRASAISAARSGRDDRPRATDRARWRGRSEIRHDRRRRRPKATARRGRSGLSVGNSPLVKTALAAGDANWGRIVMAVGKAGETADRNKLGIAVGGTQITADGGPCPATTRAPSPNT